MENKTAMHLMIDYLCSIGEYDIVNKANELLELEKQQHEKTWNNAEPIGFLRKTFEQYYSETYKKPTK